ncbi:nitrate- and nitrite sensing domain-containing protein [Dactylosporangium sp. NPDC051485]|uniref:sensor histidine kinase n=1 Tax=Dactylosporangium sp. NPDC051485 TaxID=3154846 RepID=UPI003420CC8E
MTLREGLNLFWVQSHNSNIYQPSEPLLRDLQTERRLSTAYLGDPSDRQRQDLSAARQSTDQASAAFKQSVQGWQADPSGDVELRRRVDKIVAGLDGLAATRASIDARTIDRADAANSFTGLVASFFEVYDSLGGLDDKGISADAASLIRLNQTWELISQEDALLTGALAAGSLTADDHARFVQIVGAQRFLAGDTAVRLSSADQVRYNEMSSGKSFTSLRAVEDHVIRDTRPGAKPPTTKDEWRATVDPALVDLHNVVVVGGKDIVDRSTPVAIWVFVRLLLAAGLGLGAVVASIVISITTARKLLAQLVRLRDAANDLANVRLPAVMDKLRRGERVDVRAEAPPLEFGSDEIGQVGQAFNAVQENAIRAAVEQAELRNSVRDVFVSIARRSQGLIHRQLKMLDAMEREETDAADLDALFRVDHLATRMRRHAENLIVLSGGTPGRAWRRPVPMIDVIRAATAEIEDYARVNVASVPSAGVIGRAVGDVIHLLAELVENATSFSPPHTVVQIGGQVVSNGYVVEIEDRGLGMGDAALAAANEQVRNPPEFQLSGNIRLGLFVVGRLAERHDIRVHLRRSPYGGTTAIVLIPSALIVSQSDGATVPADEAPVNGSAAAPMVPAQQAAQGIEPPPSYVREPRHAAVAVMSRPGEGEPTDNSVVGRAEPGAAAAVPLDTPEPAVEPSQPRQVTGLPRRSRKPVQPLPEPPAAPPAAAPPVSPERARARMSAFQQGSQQARQAGGGPAGPPTEQS